MNKMFSAIRIRMDEAATRRAMAHLDNHLLRDIGMPERDRRSAGFDRF